MLAACDAAWFRVHVGGHRCSNSNEFRAGADGISGPARVAIENYIRFYVQTLSAHAAAVTVAPARKQVRVATHDDKQVSRVF